MYYGYCPFEICQDEHIFRFRAAWIACFGGCGSCIGCFGCGGCIVAVAIELIVVVVSGVALFIYIKGVSSSDCRLRSILQLLSIKMICFEQSVCVRFL